MNREEKEIMSEPLLSGDDDFSPDEKIKYFDEIASHYYNKNFGSFSKTDMDLLMFRFYIDKHTTLDDSDCIDFSKCSDYKISKKLGITQQRVRNLKVKKELIYPSEGLYNWEKYFANLIENARYDSQSKKIYVNIPDPTLYLEIQNFLEENGAYIEKQLNSKLLVIRAEYFIDLVVNIEEGSTRNKIVRELKSQFKKQNKNEFDENHIGESLVKGAINLSEIAVNLSGLFSKENVLGAAITNLLGKDGSN